MAMEFDALKSFQKRVQKLKAEMPKICTDTVNECAAGMVKLVTEATPIDTGYMKGQWGVEAASKSGTTYSATVFNGTSYGLYVEEGHRLMRNGKQVGFVRGKNFVKKSVHAFQGSGEFEKVSAKALDRIAEVLSGG